MLQTVICLLGFVTVALGAFGAHGLEDVLSAKQKAWWDTATLYALVHAAAGLAVALAPPGRVPRFAGWAFAVGAVVFSGSLYAMALGAPSALGAVTPIGGLSFLLGWALLAWARLRPPERRNGG